MNLGIRLFLMILRALLRMGGAGLLFWGLHPLYLGLMWSARGYPPTTADWGRWYQVGVFIAAPAAAGILAYGLISLLLDALSQRFHSRKWLALLSGLGLGLLGAPVTVFALLSYAGVLASGDLMSVLSQIARAYLYFGPTHFLTGWILGWTFRNNSRNDYSMT